MAVMTETTTADQFTDSFGLGGADNDQLRQALARLTPRYQRAIDLRYLTNLDHEAAAKAMGLAKPAFAVVLSRALKALGRELDRLDSSDPTTKARRR